MVSWKLAVLLAALLIASIAMWQAYIPAAYAQLATAGVYMGWGVFGVYSAIQVLWPNGITREHYDSVKTEIDAREIIKNHFGISDFQTKSFSFIDTTQQGAEKYRRFAPKTGKAWVLMADMGQFFLRTVGDIGLRKTITHFDVMMPGDLPIIEDYKEPLLVSSMPGRHKKAKKIKRETTEKMEVQVNR